MTFIFLREDGESHNAAVARCAEQVLVPGLMAGTVRGEDYAAFLDAAFIDGGAKLRHKATSCGIFCGAVAVHARVTERRPVPAAAIETYVGMGAFGSSRAWIPRAKLDAAGGVLRGDVFYICSDAGSITVNGKVYSWTTWRGALNGHVGICRADGWTVPTAEGGGAPKGTGCRLSAGPKDLRKLSRKLQGVLRPNLLGAAPEPKHFEPLLVGSNGDRVKAVQRVVGAKPDGAFGPLTRAAVAVWETSHGLTVDGIWGADNQREHERS